MQMRILAMSGFVPEHICDIIRFTEYTENNSISNYCGYASDFISQVMNDDEIDGAVFPKSCDSSRILYSFFSDSQKFKYQLCIPPYGVVGGIEFFAKEIRNYKTAIENYYDIELKDISERIEKINCRNKQIFEIYKKLESYNYLDYLVSIHDMLQVPLYEQSIRIPSYGILSDKRVFLIGSFLSNIKIASMIENVGMKVIGDYLPESGRMVSRTIVYEKGDIYKNIANSILAQQVSPTQNCFRKIIDSCISEMKTKGARGVIFITQKYCEPYDYFYSVAKDIIEEQGISVLQLSIHGKDDKKVLLALEAFADKL